MTPVPSLLDSLPDNAVWVCAGDSITQAVLRTHGERGWVELLAEHLRLHHGRVTDVIINSGIGGYRAVDMEQIAPIMIDRFAGDVVHLAFGANDSHPRNVRGKVDVASFAATMTALTQRAQQAGAQTVLHTPLALPIVIASGCEGLGDYAEAVREVAAATGSWLVDHDRAWRERWGTTDPIAWMDDAVHPNAEGHRQMAALTITSLGLQKD